MTSSPAEAPPLSEAPSLDLFDIVEECLHRIKHRTDVHGSAESAERALAELRQRETETTVYGYCTVCREAQDECDEELCCLSCGNDLAPVADHGADVLTEAFGELDQRIAELEAEVSQLRAMLEEREVALAVQEGRLHGGPAELALMQLRTELRIHWYDYVDLFGETEATVYAPPDAEAQVTAAMAAVDLWRVRREVCTVVRAVYSTDGDRLRKASDKAGGAR